MADRWPSLAPILFVAADAGLLIVLVVPAWFCTVVAGLLFGAWCGTVYALIGTTLGAVAVFAMARGGLHGMERRGGAVAARLAGELRASAIGYLIALRLMPVFPFTLINIAAALASIPQRRYVLGTFIGIVPSSVIYANLGAELIDLTRQGQLPAAELIQRPRFLLPLLGLALIAASPALLRWAPRGRGG